jgi:hypothetical protein
MLSFYYYLCDSVELLQDVFEIIVHTLNNFWRLLKVLLLHLRLYRLGKADSLPVFTCQWAYNLIEIGRFYLTLLQNNILQLEADITSFVAARCVNLDFISFHHRLNTYLLFWRQLNWFVRVTWVTANQITLAEVFEIFQTETLYSRAILNLRRHDHWFFNFVWLL